MTTNKRLDPFNIHPKSALGRADRAMRARVRKNRIRFEADYRAMQAWAAGGFMSAGWSESEASSSALELERRRDEEAEL
jgi:hypothetical protein